MDRKLASIILALGIVVIAITLGFRANEERYIDNYIEASGSCYLADGTCLHDDRNNALFITGIAVGISLLLIGSYMFFDRSREILTESSRKVAQALRESKKKDEFQAFLAGFDEDEQKILKAVHEQSGILQSTLRYRTGISKTRLSLILKQLEEKGIVLRREKKKSKQVFIKRF